MADQFYAHSRPDRPVAEWEQLEDHLENVATRAADFAAAFNAADWGRLAGLWHDLGKYSFGFRDYLFASNTGDEHLEECPRKGSVDHSTAGAQHAIKCFAEKARLLAYCISGHHSGLLDARSKSGEGSLANRLDKSIPGYCHAPKEIIQQELPQMPKFTWHRKSTEIGYQVSFFGRMLFSCLVDADFLATEEFLDRLRQHTRTAPQATLTSLLASLNKYLQELQSRGQQQALKSSGQALVMGLRQQVLADCRTAAKELPGFFSLTVPTGGGKTLSSLCFALEHTLAHPEQRFQRVIMAIPFTSIIEQTTDRYREALADAGTTAIVEHHSNLDPDDLTRVTPWSRLAAENWDAPLIVTTNVQLFESLYANRTSACRKLHNLANSIIILDEAQTLPVELLAPCLASLKELVQNYGCTIVLCTATQPAIEQRDEFPIGIDNVREIVRDPQKLYESLKRVNVQKLGKVSDEELAQQLCAHNAFLCIVNTRPHAANLFSLLRERMSEHEQESLFHLSTRMCGAHRVTVLDKIRDRLKQNLPCRVVSTQLIEAGVDVDFPIVYRSLAGFDSIAQAAGRCNREGKLDSGQVYLFEPVGVKPPPFIRTAAAIAQELLPECADPLCLDAIERYFDMMYWDKKAKWSKSEVLDCLSSTTAEFDFRTAAELFRMIPDPGRPILFGWDGRGKKLVEELMGYQPPDWRVQRQLQRYTINVYEYVLKQLLESGDVISFHEQYYVLTNKLCYDRHLGLTLQKLGVRDPEDLIA